MSITINISQELQEAYQNFAREQNISQEELIQKALIAYMEDLEDLNAALEWQMKSTMVRYLLESFTKS
ncbi:DUF6290 family protein [Helicobacter cinaedi]|uniref:DUF6290 family protein n=1 Tax=Helicobacter cinaedi TaxID=213 RepID=UPI000CF016A0|nr:DUF6290 family protein [Helicobacter cinaedi]